MPFDPHQVGFTWPQETLLTNPSGETMTVRPEVANFAGLRQSNGHRIEECYKYYSSSNGIMTELEVKKWLAGGDEVCRSLLSSFRELFGNAPGVELSLTSVVQALQNEGYSKETIGINLRWLLQDGFVVATRQGEEWLLKVAKW